MISSVSAAGYLIRDDWRAFILAQFIDAVDAYIRLHNETGIKLSLGGRSPTEYPKSVDLMP
jgi:hypothetical protein